MPFKSEKQRKWMHSNEPDMAKKWEKEENVNEVEYHTWPENPESHPVGDHDKVTETAKRDYKDEYKKFQSSPKSKKYRAELNKYNRKKGTYGNGDGKDASHKSGKIVGFEKESVNRGRREKSRLKKEQKLREVIRKIVREDFAGAYPEHQRKKFDNTRRKQSEVLGYKLTGQDDVRTEIDDATVKEGNVGISTKKGKSIELTHRKSGKEIVVTNTPSTLKKYAKMGYLISMPEGKLTESGILYRAGVKKYGKEGMRKIQQAAGKRKSHAAIGAIKDKYEKGKKDEGKLNEAQEPLWTHETVKDAVKQIKKGLKNAVPYLDDIGYSTLGGKDRISILGKISLDPKKEWPNGILQNSRWALIHFQPDGTLDTIRMSGWTSYEQRKKVPILRKSKNKSLKQAIDRMGKYFTVVRTKYPK